MKATPVFAVVLALGGLLCGTQRLSSDEPKDGVKEGAEAVIIIKNVEVKMKKADGSSWDPMDGAPDLFVRVTNTSVKDSKAFDTKVKDDVYKAEFNEPTTVKVRAGHKVKFEVLDSDVAVNDTIGTAIHEFTEKEMSSTTFELENFGQVIVLRFELRKL